jgi:hypothetical protein
MRQLHMEGEGDAGYSVPWYGTSCTLLLLVALRSASLVVGCQAHNGRLCSPPYPCQQSMGGQTCHCCSLRMTLSSLQT